MKAEPVKTLDIEGLVVKIYQDEDAQNPEQMTDAPVYLYHYHRDFYQCSKDLPFKTPAEFHEWWSGILAEGKPQSWGIWPLLSYIHGGVVLAIKGTDAASNFPDQKWDVSRCGFILIPRAQWVEYSGTPMEEVKWLEIAEAHVKEWNQFLAGDVYGYTIEGRDEESCWGFYGMEAVEEDAREAAQVVARGLATEKAEFTRFCEEVEQRADLDDLVHDTKSAEASDINNGGPEAQVRYLLESGWTKKDLLQRSSAVHKMLDVSTAHMPSTSPDWGSVRAVQHETGWVAFVPGVDGTPSEAQISGEPAWLRELLEYAREEECLVINFDQDSGTYDHLPKWEW
jgi:hypothetical protein